jgi:type I restriction enzyme M protein
LPYMLAQMNLLLHGLEAPQIAYGNTLDRKINEIGHSERVDVILTNPPFGGEEEVGIKANFPPNMQTAETALLFLQYIMRKLRVAGAPVPGGKPATAAAARPWWCPTAPCSATASAPSSRRNCSRSSACTPSCACRKAFLRPTPTFRPTCCSSSAAARPTPSGTTSCPARGPQEVQQDRAAAVRGVRCGAGLVERPRGRPAGMEGGLCRPSAPPPLKLPRRTGSGRGRTQRGHRVGQAAARTGASHQRRGQRREGRRCRTAARAEGRTASHEQAAKAAQAEGDALYWPIYNLDLKNPNAKAGLEHADPKDLIASMRATRPR